MKQTILSVVITLTAMVAMAQTDVPPVGFNPRATISEEVGITIPVTFIMGTFTITALLDFRKNFNHAVAFN